MSTLKVNNIIPFSGQTVNIQGDFLPSSGSNTTQSLGSVSNPWADLYVSTGSVVFVAPGTQQNPQQAAVAVLKAGGESAAGIGQVYGMMYTDTNFGFRGSFSVGTSNRASGTASLANGLANTSSGFYSHAEGNSSKATGTYSHAEGNSTSAGDYSHAEGNVTLADGAFAHAEGISTTASGYYSHAEGSYTRTAAFSGQGMHAEGYGTLASGSNSHAEGSYTTSSGYASHAEGASTWATGLSSHAEGNSTIAAGDYSHAEGITTSASGMYSHAAGMYTTASGIGSFTHGLNIEAPGYAQTVVGQYNALGNSSSLFVVGAGVSVGSRKNGFSVEVDASGNYGAHVVIPTNNTNPGNPKTGSMYFNPGTNLMFIYNGTAWRSSSFS